MTDLLDFESLISPVAVDEFFDTYWEKRPLHQSAIDPKRLLPLASVEDVESIAMTGLGRADKPGSVLAGRCVDEHASYWDIPVQAGANKAIHSVLHAFADGYSIVVNSVDSFWPPVAELTRQIESSLQQPVGATLYYSPANSQGFPAHFDEHDAMVLQIDGEKIWDLYKPPAPIAGDADPWLVPSPLGEPAIRAHLRAGDVLYLPRGWTHRVTTGDVPSLHVTMGIRSLRWADLVVRAAQDAVRTSAALQGAIPLHQASGRTEINEHVADLLADLTLRSGADPYETLMTEVLESRPPELGGQAQHILHAEANLEPSTLLRRRPGLRPLLTRTDDEATIRFAGNGVTAALSFLPAFELLVVQDVTTVAELSAAIGTDAAPLARALIINGLLAPEAVR